MNLDEIKARLDKFENRGNSKDRIDYKTVYWKPPVGKSTIRIVPSAFNVDNPFKELRIHYGLAKFPILSPISYGEEDPINEVGKKLTDGEYDEDTWQTAKKLFPKTRVFVPVIVRGEEEQGVRLWQFGVQLFQRFLQMATDEEIGDFTDVNEGRDIKLNTTDASQTGTGFNKTEITGVSLNTSPLAKTKKQINEWLENQPNPMDLYKKHTHEELKAILREYMDGGSSDEEQLKTAEVKAPTRKGRTGGKTKEDEFEALIGSAGDSNPSVDIDDLPFD